MVKILARNGDAKSWCRLAHNPTIVAMRTRLLTHLLPWLLLLGLGSCAGAGVAARAEPDSASPGPAGIEQERGGQGFMADEG